MTNMRYGGGSQDETQVPKIWQGSFKDYWNSKSLKFTALILLRDGDSSLKKHKETMIHRPISHYTLSICFFCIWGKFFLLKYIINSFLQLLKYFYHFIKFFFNNEASPPPDRGVAQVGVRVAPPGHPDNLRPAEPIIHHYSRPPVFFSRFSHFFCNSC